jgi:hypothetical protein
MLTINPVGAADVAELMPMLRAYCDFYRVDPSDDRLRALVTALIDDPSEGVQLIARDRATPLGFATIYWTWQTLHAARVGVLNDLFVVPRSWCGKRRRTTRRHNVFTTVSAPKGRRGSPTS